MPDALQKVAPASRPAVARRSSSAVVSVALLTLAIPVTATAQSLQTIHPQQCVWHSGDNPAWSAPNFDDSTWQPWSTWHPLSPEPRIWIRCRADLSSLNNVAQPALQISLYAAYEVYVDGRKIGEAGNLQTGVFTMNTARDWPLSGDLAPPSVIALRVTRRIVAMVPTGPVPPLQIEAGAASLLHDRRSSVILTQVTPRLLPTICFGIIGVLGVVLIPLWLNDRSRGELLLLAISCIFLPVIYSNYVAAATFLPYSVAAYLPLWAVPACIVNVTSVLFPFALARRRVPVVFWILILVGNGLYLPAMVIEGFQPLRQALWLDILRSHQLEAIGDIFRTLEHLSPFVAFLPWKNLSRRMKPLATCSIAWGASMMLFFVVRFTSTRVIGIPDLQARWFSQVSDIEAITVLAVIVALLILLFREQQQTAQERAILAGEMASAREMQQYFIPEKLPQTPGLAIQSVYLPSREVGGDFFQVLPDPRDGSTLIVVGDVAGKGLQAAMLSALIVGAIRVASQFTREPGEILALLNQRLQGRALVTCLASQIGADGWVRLANAGHLPPYLNGEELEVAGSLPLGAAPGITFGVTEFRLAEGETMLLVSDGIVEAQNDQGELFGFDRTRQISTQSAEAIAQAAQQFGQEDDITVLTVQFLGKAYSEGYSVGLELGGLTAES